MSRLKKLFQEKKQNVLSVFYTAGFPKRDDTASIARHLQAAGADIIEIGIPFSDPVADGPTIQASNKIALDNGMTVKLLLEQVKEIRKSVTMPIVLMGYLNPVLQYGFEKFCNDAAAASVDGLILPDMPLDEFNEHRALTTSLGLDVIFLISPTTSAERIAVIDGLSSGFVYAVSSSSTTGAKKGFTSEQEEYFQKLKDAGLKNPFLIGFGISDRETFSKASQFSSGAIVGSAFINLLKESNNFESDIAQFVRSLKA